jgi:hypothetical protein
MMINLVSDDHRANARSLMHKREAPSGAGLFASISFLPFHFPQFITSEQADYPE